MTANASRLQCLLWDVESAWGETTTSMSGAVKLTITEPIDVSGLTHVMLDPGRVTQYLQETTAGIPGVMGGSFQVRGYLCGHGSSTSGAVTNSDLGTFLGWCLGAIDASPAAGTTINGGTSAVDSLVTTASGTFAAGALFRLGAKGDTDGDGQWNVVGSHTLTDLVPKFEVPAAPANAAVVYSAENVYTVEAASGSAISGYRFQIFTANNQYTCHGCFPMALTFSGLGPGEIPRYQATIGVSWWEPRADTFPETTALTTHVAAPVAAGSWMVQDYGTDTRNALSFRAHSVDLTLGIVPVNGPDGANAYQRIVGARRVPSTIMINATVDAGAASSTPTYFTDWLTNGPKHILGSLSVGIGTSVGYYAPRCFWRGPRPTQADVDGLNRIPISFIASTDTAGATALERSAFRLGLA
jgi:hypothetical protein